MNDTKALLFQTGESVLNSAGEEEREKISNSHLNVLILETQENEAQANIKESTDPQVNNLFDRLNYSMNQY